MVKNKVREIDYIIQKMGFKEVRGKTVKNYNYLYTANETDMKVRNITTSCYGITYDVIIYMSGEEWKHRFDQIGFILKIRKDYHAQCKFVSANDFIQGYKYIKYSITTFNRR